MTAISDGDETAAAWRERAVFLKEEALRQQARFEAALGDPAFVNLGLSQEQKETIVSFCSRDGALRAWDRAQADEAFEVDERRPRPERANAPPQEAQAADDDRFGPRLTGEARDAVYYQRTLAHLFPSGWAPSTEEVEVFRGTERLLVSLGCAGTQVTASLRSAVRQRLDIEKGIAKTAGRSSTAQTWAAEIAFEKAVLQRLQALEAREAAPREGEPRAEQVAEFAAIARTLRGSPSDSISFLVGDDAPLADWLQLREKMQRRARELAKQLWGGL